MSSGRNVSEALSRSHPWRVGRRLGRTIYVQIYAKPMDGDLLIGMMDTSDLAKMAVEAHNQIIEMSRSSDLAEGKT